MLTTKNRFVAAGLVALTIAGTTIATTSQAEARNYHHGGGIAAGIAGGLLGGALIAGAVGGPVYGAPAYGPPVYYGPPQAYYEPVYHRCHFEWRHNGWGERYQVQVCYR
ncbi:hypothetical protein G6L28_07280 [Agrobacterium larrymoorei]|uniref:hypothetical protein n=1 Tax=Agrobacterium larrymoorei TaxID=160699 RepID=UPI00157330B8|nr:hypothetical protein [Agrobacterium larrymoorei]NTJ42401.1 hypothetical protein [Agrobacterium larrymoorei]